MKKIGFIVLTIIGITFILGMIGVYYLSRDLDTLDTLTFETINLSLVEDGTYTGHYDGGRFSNTVEVEVLNHEIKQITIIDAVSLERTEISDALLKRIIEEQSLEVDTEAGATTTSHAYIKSIENALREGVINE